MDIAVDLGAVLPSLPKIDSLRQFVTATAVAPLQIINGNSSKIMLPRRRPRLAGSRRSTGVGETAGSYCPKNNRFTELQTNYPNTETANLTLQRETSASLAKPIIEGAILLRARLPTSIPIAANQGGTGRAFRTNAACTVSNSNLRRSCEYGAINSSGWRCK